MMRDYFDNDGEDMKTCSLETNPNSNQTKLKNQTNTKPS